jgi:hypothetical protein
MEQILPTGPERDAPFGSILPIGFPLANGRFLRHRTVGVDVLPPLRSALQQTGSARKRPSGRKMSVAAYGEGALAGR